MNLKRNETSRGTAYLIVVTGVSTLRRLIVAISAVSDEEIFTFPFQGVDATFEVDVKAGTIVYCEGSLCRYVDVRRIRRIL